MTSLIEAQKEKPIPPTYSETLEFNKKGIYTRTINSSENKNKKIQGTYTLRKNILITISYGQKREIPFVLRGDRLALKVGNLSAVYTRLRARKTELTGKWEAIGFQRGTIVAPLPPGMQIKMNFAKTGILTIFIKGVEKKSSTQKMKYTLQGNVLLTSDKDGTKKFPIRFEGKNKMFITLENTTVIMKRKT